MKILDFAGCCQGQINDVTEYINNNNIKCQSTGDGTRNLIVSDEDADIVCLPEFVWYDISIRDVSKPSHTRIASEIIADINRCAALIDRRPSYERTGTLYRIMYDLSSELESLMSPWSQVD